LDERKEATKAKQRSKEGREGKEGKETRITGGRKVRRGKDKGPGSSHIHSSSSKGIIVNSHSALLL